MAENNYIELAKINKDLLFLRRQIEWKMSLSYWGGLAVVVGYLLKQGYNMNTLGDMFYIFCFFLIFFGVVFTYWHVSLNGSNRKDLDLIMYYRHKVEAQLEGGPDIPVPVGLDIPAFKYALKRSGYLNCFLPQAITTLLLTAAAIVLLAVNKGSC